VIDPQVLVKANINQPIVATPPICMDDAGNVSFASNNGLQGAFGGIWHDLRVDVVASFKQAENHCLFACTPTTQSSYSSWAEIGLISFEFTAQG